LNIFFSAFQRKESTYYIWTITETYASHTRVIVRRRCMLTVIILLVMEMHTNFVL